ncbi:hypothetical protein [Ectobacillus ponti]|nr:hypothetical protein [Ectobacillus ponti]
MAAEELHEAVKKAEMLQNMRRGANLFLQSAWEVAKMEAAG